MDNVVVYIEAWQMQCCGEPFAKGDVVSWEAFVATDALEIDGETVNIDFYEEHHTTHRHIMFQITGQVERVMAEYSLKIECESPIAYDNVKKYYVDCDDEVNSCNFPQNGVDWGYVVWLSNVRLNLVQNERSIDESQYARAMAAAQAVRYKLVEMIKTLLYGKR